MAADRVRPADKGAHASQLQLAGSDADPDLPLPGLYPHPHPVNICFMIWSNVVLWYVLESLLHQFYFTTLVYYFAKKYTEKTIPETRRKPYIISLLAGYAVFCLLELGIFIYMVNSGLGHCKGTSPPTQNWPN